MFVLLTLSNDWIGFFCTGHKTSKFFSYMVHTFHSVNLVNVALSKPLDMRLLSFMTRMLKISFNVFY